MVEKLLNEINKIELVDMHSHIDAAHPAARGLHDILLYHMVISELYAAGCPDGDRLPEEPTEEYALYRLERAVPYVKYIQGTSCFWGVRIILRDLYGWNDNITEENWRELHELIKSKGCGLERAKEIAGKANIIKTSTELWRGRNHLCDKMFYYSLEWAFFTRGQWGVYDAPLLELEKAWNEDIPGPPIPVTAKKSDFDFEREIKTIEDVDAAIKHYCDHIPYDEVESNASHFSTDINYRDVTREEMIKALANRDNATPADQDVYANYINEEFLKAVTVMNKKKGKDIIIQYSLGAEPLPYETGSKMRVETIFELARIIARHKELNFEIHVSSMHSNQAWCTLCRELPNLQLDGFWWHNFFPGFIQRIITERMDMLPVNRQAGFFTDAYSMDWAYAKATMIKRQYAEVLAKKIAMGEYDFDRAIEVVKGILHVDGIPMVYEK